jgi:hypothetical protein
MCAGIAGVAQSSGDCGKMSSPVVLQSAIEAPGPRPLGGDGRGSVLPGTGGTGLLPRRGLDAGTEARVGIRPEPLLFYDIRVRQAMTSWRELVEKKQPQPRGERPGLRMLGPGENRAVARAGGDPSNRIIP